MNVPSTYDTRTPFLPEGLVSIFYVEQDRNKSASSALIRWFTYCRRPITAPFAVSFRSRFDLVLRIKPSVVSVVCSTSHSKDEWL